MNKKRKKDYLLQRGLLEEMREETGGCEGSVRKQTSVVCEICGGAFCDDHIFKVNNSPHH
ncbi:MAG: hypothetical protein M3P08_10815 [Thermoproteota archaeon]|nr:hypothetical protein [Thermoproteota archaeon]